MDKFDFLEFAAAMKMAPTKDRRESRHRDRCHSGNRDTNDIRSTSKMVRKLDKDRRCPVPSKPSKDTRMESEEEIVSDTDSNPGIGFLDLYRGRVQCEQNGGTPSKLFQFDRLIMKLETSTETSVELQSDGKSPTGSSSSERNQAPRSARPPPLQPPRPPTECLGPSSPWTQSYLKLIFKSCNEVPSLSHWQVECDQDFTILETPFIREEPSPVIRKPPKRQLPDSSKESPCRNYNAKPSCQYSSQCVNSASNLVQPSGKHRKKRTSKQQKEMATKPRSDSAEKIPKRIYYQKTIFGDSPQSGSLKKKAPEPLLESSKLNPSKNNYPKFSGKKSGGTKSSDETLFRYSEKHRKRTSEQEKGLSTKSLRRNSPPQPLLESVQRISKRSYYPKLSFEDSQHSDLVPYSEEPPEGTTEHPKGQPTKPLGRNEFQCKYPGNQIESGSRGPKRRECEEDSGGTRKIEGFVDTWGHASTSCRFMIKPEETHKFNSSSRSRSQLPETSLRPRTIEWELFWEQPKTGEGQVLNTLYPIQNLTLSDDTDPELDEERQTQNGRQGAGSVTKVDSWPSGQQLNFYCSRNLQLSSLETCDIFMEVWRGKTPLADDNQGPAILSDGRMKNLRLKAKDKVDAGFSSDPIFKGCPVEELRERAHYFAAEFDELGPVEKVQYLAFRISHIRYLQSKIDRIFREYYQKNRTVALRVATNGIETCCPMDPMDHRCPLVTNESLLSHALSHHVDGRSVEVSELFSGRLLLIFNPRSFDIGKNSCMSALMYGGIRNHNKSLPERRFMPIQNMELPSSYAKYSEHLPLFVMICRNRRSAIEGGDSVGEHDDSVTLWVLSRDLPVKLYVLMTVLNRRLDVTRSSIMKVHPLHQSHNCLEFVRTNDQFMRLNEEDLCALTSDNTEPLYLEISVKEYRETLPPTGAA